MLHLIFPFYKRRGLYFISDPKGSQYKLIGILYKPKKCHWRSTLSSTLSMSWVEFSTVILYCSWLCRLVIILLRIRKSTLWINMKFWYQGKRFYLITQDLNILKNCLFDWNAALFIIWVGKSNPNNIKWNKQYKCQKISFFGNT